MHSLQGAADRPAVPTRPVHLAQQTSKAVRREEQALTCAINHVHESGAHIPGQVDADEPLLLLLQQRERPLQKPSS